MPSVDPALEPVLTALVRGLQAPGIPFCVIGALALELLLETKPAVRTNDADAVVLVDDLAAFDAVKQGLASSGFSKTRLAYRLTHKDGGIVDILPYSRQLAPDGTLRLPPDLVLNMAGFDRVVAAAVPVTLDSGLVVPVAPLPLYALLKLVAYTDRKAEKDLAAVEHLLRHYADDDDRRWGLEHRGELVEYDYGPAYLLGKDGTQFLGPDLVEVLQPLLATLTDRDGDSGAVPHRDDDHEDQWKPRREDLFLWYGRGLDV